MVYNLKTLRRMEGMLPRAREVRTSFQPDLGLMVLQVWTDGRDTEERVAMKTPSSRYSSSPEAWKALLSAHHYGRAAMQIQVSCLLLG